MSDKRQRILLPLDISKLPGHIVDKILSHLSLRDAVRTSILSRNWRYRWITLPNLEFDHDQSDLLTSSQHPRFAKQHQLVRIIDQVLLLHTGPLYKFRLSHQDFRDLSAIDRWILYLSRSSVKEFILDIWEGDKYKIPSSIYSFKNLVHLELFNCVLKAWPEFNGFKSMKSLFLANITMEQTTFEQMIWSSPLLERLTLEQIDGFTMLNIHAPNLLSFDFGGVFDDLSFKDTLHLGVVIIRLDAYSAGTERNLNSCNLVKFVSSLPHIQHLDVQSHDFLKYLAAASGSIPEKLPTNCVDLTFLSISINFNDIEENLAALCLVRSSPNLKKLELHARTEEQTTANILGKRFPLNQLRVVKIVGILGSRQELNFIEFLLSNAPLLETMTVKPKSVDGRADLMKKLLRFRRASISAQIIYLDP